MSYPSPPPDEAPAPTPRPGLWARYRLLLAVGLLVALLDQALKAWIRTHLPFGQVWTPWPEPWARWVRIVHWRNTGAAFGLYQGANDVLLWIAVAVIVFVVWHFRHTALQARCLRWGLALQVGGALGNLWDRVQHGSVTDFIAVGQFPVFNLADVAITLGVGCLLWSTLWEEDGQPAPPTPVPQPGETDTAAPTPPSTAPEAGPPPVPPEPPAAEKP